MDSTPLTQHEFLLQTASVPSRTFSNLVAFVYVILALVCLFEVLWTIISGNPLLLRKFVYSFRIMQSFERGRKEKAS